MSKTNSKQAAATQTFMLTYDGFGRFPFAAKDEADALAGARRWARYQGMTTSGVGVRAPEGVECNYPLNTEFIPK